MSAVKSIIPLLPALLVLSTGAVAQNRAPVVTGELGTKVDKYMSRMAVFGLSGSLLVAKDGRIIVMKGYGLADDERQIPVSADMPFVIASLSKQFTAAAILKLEMQGRLRTSDTIVKFFPAAPLDKRGITIHQLLTHTAGLPYLDDKLFHKEFRSEAMYRLLSLPLVNTPGTSFAYSSPGYTLLAGIIEQASGQSFENYLRANIFDPAGMTNTGFMGDPGYGKLNQLHSYSGAKDEGITSDFPYGPDFKHTIFATSPYGSDFAGAGSIYSTVSDLYKWENALADDKILSGAAREQFFKAHVPVQGPMSYAYGWNTTQTIRGTRLVFHAGDLGGYNAEYRRYLDENLVIIFLSNRRVNGTGYRIAAMNPLSLLIAGTNYPEPPATVELPPEKIDRLTGRYQLPTGGAIMAWTEHGRLMMSAEGQDGLLMLAGGKAPDSLALVELGNVTRDVVMAVSRGDFALLKERLHPSYPFDDMKNGLVNDLRALNDTLGAFKDVEIVGSVMPTPTTARTYIRLRFERGSVQQEYSWSGAHISAIERRAPRALVTRFAPASENAVVSFDPFTGATSEIEFTPDSSGVIPEISVTTGKGTLRAVRTGKI